jgi:hypothetical protein
MSFKHAFSVLHKPSVTISWGHIIWQKVNLNFHNPIPGIYQLEQSDFKLIVEIILLVKLKLKFESFNLESTIEISYYMVILLVVIYFPLIK